MSDEALMIINVLLIIAIVAAAFYRHLIHPMRDAPASVLIVDVLLIIVLVAFLISYLGKKFWIEV